MGPPAVVSALFGKNSESIQVSGFDYIINTFPLFEREALSAFVFFRPGEVKRRMGDIEITTKDNGLPARGGQGPTF